MSDTAARHLPPEPASTFAQRLPIQTQYPKWDMAAWPTQLASPPNQAVVQSLTYPQHRMKTPFIFLRCAPLILPRPLRRLYQCFRFRRWRMKLGKRHRLPKSSKSSLRAPFPCSDSPRSISFPYNGARVPNSTPSAGPRSFPGNGYAPGSGTPLPSLIET